MKLRNTLAASAILILTGIISNTANSQSICQPCPSGQWSAGGTSTTCTPCTAGFFCQGGNRTQCTAGQHCPAGSSSSQQCPAGHRCPNGIAQACPAGTFQPLMGQASCNQCPNARHVANMDGSGCCARHNNECLTGTVKRGNNSFETDITNRGLTVQWICMDGHWGNSLESIPNNSTGTHCYCRARTSHGAVSTWGHTGVWEDYDHECQSKCRSFCSSPMGYFYSWGPHARW